ncbi:helix-turn-helix domain-containing protein [Halobacillus amylolyticus]|uniref:Helix-turn-helix domain-containing protein n=1 Tax=Halobacillus amylolyticus TaxID=2932259 RepID=A0ABY4H6Z8_9BACI|nr:helix-turn-helix transcriptional regulator [Halobacillus amylolyticus]UOR10646.1 helix-turn-helix domain-containing protein [Halobacillus amylolyticus]
MEIEKAFGHSLKIIRREQSLSQEKLAQLSDLDRTYISLLERGKRNPTIVTIFNLANALNINPTDLIKDTERLLYPNK